MSVPGRGLLGRTFARRSARVGAVLLGIVVVWSVLGPVLHHVDPVSADVLAFGRPPSRAHWFGTNDIGQDLYAQTLVGLRKSLVIGFLAGPAATAVAAVVGTTAGYAGGWWDRVLVAGIDLALVVPAFYLLVLVAPATRRFGWLATAAGITAFSWMILARVVRGQTRALRGRGFVRAAVFMGVPTRRIITRHLLPNLASLLVADATLGVGAAILTEATLGYLGFGVQVPDVSLGTLLAAGAGAATTRPWLFAFPSAALVVTVLASSLLGDGLRDAIDPTSGAARG